LVCTSTFLKVAKSSTFDNTGYPTEVGALFTTGSSIRVSRVVRVSRVSVMVSVMDSVK